MRFAPYLAAIAGAGALVWYVMDLRGDNAAKAAEIDALTVRVTGCEARVLGNTEHGERANEIDGLSDDDLRNRASEWLLPN